MREFVARGHLSNWCYTRLPLGSPSGRFYARSNKNHGGMVMTCNLTETSSHSPPAAFVTHTVPREAQRPLQIAIREATFGEFWEVADTHCGAFLPDLVFPMDTLMRLDRVVAMVGSLPLPSGCQRKCLVAATHRSHLELMHGPKHLEDEFQTDLLLHTVLGVLTIDTLAEFLPRRKPIGSRRTGIAYISNVAVRPTARRKGIAKRLVEEAEVLALHWGCRSIALHCDKVNTGAWALYAGAGYKAVKVPVNAKWPQPMCPSDSEFSLMMKLLGSI